MPFNYKSMAPPTGIEPVSSDFQSAAMTTFATVGSKVGARGRNRTVANYLVLRPGIEPGSR